MPGKPEEAGPILRQAIENIADGVSWFDLNHTSTPFHLKLEHICQNIQKPWPTTFSKKKYRLGHLPPLVKLRLQLALWPRRRRRLQRSMARPSQKVLCSRSGRTSKMQLGRKHRKCKDHVCWGCKILIYYIYYVIYIIIVIVI